MRKVLPISLGVILGLGILTSLAALPPNLEQWQILIAYCDPPIPPENACYCNDDTTRPITCVSVIKLPEPLPDPCVFPDIEGYFDDDESWVYFHAVIDDGYYVSDDNGSYTFLAERDLVQAWLDELNE